MRRTIPVYSPSKLNLYQRCPYAYWRKYVDKTMPRVPPTPALARGVVTHTILSKTLRKFAGGTELPESVRDLACDEIKEFRRYFDDDQIAADIEQVERCAAFALDHFDITAKPVIIERKAEYLWSTKAGAPFARLQTRVDIILEHADGTYEIIDWKTGDSTFPDYIQNLLLFVTARGYLRDRRRVSDDQIRLTVAYLGAREYVTVDTSRESMIAIWRRIGELIRQIHRGDNWKPQRNNLCEYCPLCRNGCPLEGPNYLEMAPDSMDVYPR